MIIITNGRVIVGRDDPRFPFFEKHLAKTEDEQFLPLYTLTESGLEFGRGLSFLLGDSLKEAEDLSRRTLDYPVSYDLGSYESLLPGYTLREDQTVAIVKALEARRGILQMATGSGKSLCIAGVMKYLTDTLGYTPPSILLEPTNYLVDEMCARMNSYGVHADRYSKGLDMSRNALTVTHPIALCNALKNDPGLLRGIKVLIADEAHHEHSATWSQIYLSCPNIEISLGFSAYLVDARKITSMNFADLDYNEAKAISCTGQVLMNLDTSYYIRLGILATPVLIRMLNPADEPIWNDQDWHEIRTKRLESPARLAAVCDTVKCFAERGFKTLVLSATKKFAVDILRGLHARGIGHKSVCSFGSGEYVSIDGNGRTESSKDPSWKERFASGEITAMVCTSHMFEGADIPNLDTVVMAEVGKQIRKVIQGVGRGLRRTKKGRYAYVVDFTDHCGGVLKRQAGMRMAYYRSVIGVAKVCENVNPDRLPEAIDLLESGQA